MSLSRHGSFDALAGMGFDRPNIQAFHAATMGTTDTDVTFSINGFDPNTSNDPTQTCGISVPTCA